MCGTDSEEDSSISFMLYTHLYIGAVRKTWIFLKVSFLDVFKRFLYSVSDTARSSRQSSSVLSTLAADPCTAKANYGIIGAQVVPGIRIGAIRR